MKRRALLHALATAGSALLFAPKLFAAAAKFPVTLSEDQWRNKLSAQAYDVLRTQGTEPPFTSALNDEHRTGLFRCAGCATKLFSSGTKFDSGTGWPSFYQPLDKAVETTTDYKLLYPRVEVHCATCGGHLGHVFEDGPKPTGLRYCMNGVAMTFEPAAA